MIFEPGQNALIGETSVCFAVQKGSMIIVQAGPLTAKKPHIFYLATIAAASHQLSISSLSPLLLLTLRVAEFAVLPGL